MAEKLGSWKKLVKKSPYLAGHDVKIDEIGQTHLILTIKDVKFVESQGLKHNNYFLTISFVEINPETNKPYKDMLVNSTNASKIQIATSGTEEPTDWIGHKIELTTERGTWFGETTDAIRVTSRKIPKSKPVLSIGKGRWSEIIEKVATGSTTLEHITSLYDVSSEVLGELTYQISIFGNETVEGEK